MDEIVMLIIEHKHGRSCYVHRTIEGAMNTLEAYAREWWAQEHLLKNKTIPADQKKVIEQYFEAMQDYENYEMIAGTIGE